jgi:plastocyanin
MNAWLRRGALGLTVFVGLALAALLIATPAGAANRRISISNYQWSDKDLHLDLGEHVNWYWIGPDTMHSVTGTNANAFGLDSDPTQNTPNHTIGDNFELSFDKPGVYEFHCKLHSTVRGTITVSDKPGDPTSEPDPVPQSQVDLAPPVMGGPVLSASSFGRNGTALHYTLDEKARLSADVYLLRPGKKPKYAGYEDYKAGHVGFNNVRFGKRSKHFKAKPGKYRADLVSEDDAANTTRPVHIKFKIFRR